MSPSSVRHFSRGEASLRITVYRARKERSEALAKELSLRGHTIRLFHDEEILSISRWKLLSFYRGYGKLAEMARKSDLLFTERELSPSLSSAIAGKRHRVPFVFTLNAQSWVQLSERGQSVPAGSMLARRLLPSVQKWTYGRAARIICNSRFLAEKFSARHPELSGRVRAVYNGIDFDRFGGPGERSPKEDLGALLCCTTLNFPGKAEGLKFLIRALEPLLESDPSAHLTVAAKNSVPKRRRDLESFVNGLPCRDKLTLHFNYPRVEELLRNSDLFVYATPVASNDSLPRTILESQAAGIPAVVTATAGCPEALLHEQTGLAVPYEAGKLREGVRRVLSDPGLAHEWGCRAAETVRQRFSWEEMGRKYAEVFKEAIEDPDPSPGGES